MRKYSSIFATALILLATVAMSIPTNMIGETNPPHDDGIPADVVTSTNTSAFTITATSGHMFKNLANYNDCWSSSFATTTSIGALSMNIAQQRTASTHNIYRSGMVFNTEAIPDDATILSVNLSVYPTSTLLTAVGGIIVIQNGQPLYPHDPVRAEDYNKSLYSGNGGSKTLASFTINIYNNITFNSSGLNWINKTGPSKFVLRTARDIAGQQIAVVGQTELVIIHGPSNTNPAKLYVTYTRPDGTWYTNGDWMIETGENIEHSNKTIVVNGNLTVEGNLKLTNVTMNLTNGTIVSGNIQMNETRFDVGGNIYNVSTQAILSSISGSLISFNSTSFSSLNISNYTWSIDNVPSQYTRNITLNMTNNILTNLTLNVTDSENITFSINRTFLRLFKGWTLTTLPYNRMASDICNLLGGEQIVSRELGGYSTYIAGYSQTDFLIENNQSFYIFTGNSLIDITSSDYEVPGVYHLSAGWNLISWYSIGYNTSIFDSISNITNIVGRNTTTEIYWTYIPTLTPVPVDLFRGQGYYIYATSATDIFV